MNNHQFQFRWVGDIFEVNFVLSGVILKNCIPLNPLPGIPGTPITPMNMGYQFNTKNELFLFLDNIITNSKKRFNIRTECLHASPGPIIGPSGTVNYSCLHCKQNYSVDIIL